MRPPPPLFADPPLLADEPAFPEAELLLAEPEPEPDLLEAEPDLEPVELPRPPPLLFDDDADFELLEDEPLFDEPEEPDFDEPPLLPEEDPLLDDPLFEPDDELLDEVPEPPDDAFLELPPDELFDDEPPLDDELFDELEPPDDERDDEPLFDEPLLLPPELDLLADEPPAEEPDLLDPEDFDPDDLLDPDDDLLDAEDEPLLPLDDDFDRPEPLPDLPWPAPVAFSIFDAVSSPAPASAAERMSAATSFAPSITLETVVFLVLVTIEFSRSFLSKATSTPASGLSGGLQSVFCVNCSSFKRTSALCYRMFSRR